MSLTGWPLFGLLLLLAVAFPAVALLGWTRLRGRFVAILVCASLLLAGQAAGIGLVAALINRTGHYYTSWSQVQNAFATPPPTQHVASARTGTASPVAWSSPTATPAAQTARGFSTPAQWASRGKLETVTMTGASSRLTSHAFIYLPPEYFQAAYRHTSFPAAEVFTGFPGNDSNLVGALNYPGVLRDQVAQGHAKPMILVMMRPSVTFPRDTECTDVPGGPQSLTFFAQDVPSAVGQHFRVQPAEWGSIGDSTGGYCAAKLSMTYPATFRAAVSLSGYYRALQDHTTGDLWGGSTVVRNLNDLRWRLQHQSAPATSLLVTISKEERGHLGYSDTQQFLRLVKSPLQVDSIITPHGGHNFRAWGALLPRSLDWLSHKLQTPKVP